MRNKADSVFRRSIWSVGLRVRSFFLQLIFISLFAVPTFASADESIQTHKEFVLRDFAVFRINNEVILYSDLVEKDLLFLDILNCLPGHKILLKALRLNDVSELLKDEDSKHVLFERLLLWRMAQTYAGRFRISQNYRVLLENYFTKNTDLVQRCQLPQAPYRNWPQHLRRIIESEVYFLDRFIRERDRGLSGEEVFPLDTFSKTQLEEVRTFVKGLRRQLQVGTYFGP